MQLLRILAKKYYINKRTNDVLKKKKKDLSSEFKKANQGNTNGYINATIK